MPTAVVEITHGSAEYGKDLVLVDDDPLSERVAAFVVKPGRVGGKSAGVVDEIVSQVKQAIAHPAKLRSVLTPKKVNQVYVVVAGTVTSNARKRINGEVRGSVQDVWDVRRLVDEFTDHYPEVFYEAATLDFLQRRITELEAHPLFVKIAEDKNLSDWFVDPFVSSSEAVEHLENEVPRQVTTYSFVKLRDILTQKRRLLLVGEPGSGKSAVVAKMAIDMMKEAFRKATKERDSQTGVPILITARQIIGYHDVPGMLCDQFGDTHQEDFVVSALLVDGLDEVRPQDRELVLERSRSFAEELRCCLIVTTRWTEALQDPISGFHQVQLLEFKVNQALRLFEKLVPEGVLLKSLREGLDLIQNQLHMTPLTLVLLIEVVREYREIPASVTELYDRFFDYALGRHDRDKGIEVLFAYQLKKAFLGALGHDLFFKADRISAPRSEYADFVSRFCDRQGVPERERFTAEIERSNILRYSGDDVEFVHRSFLDYFVALHLHRPDSDREVLIDELVGHYFGSRWSEVTFFYVGISRDADPKLLNRILDSPNNTLRASVMRLLAGRLLQAGWLAPFEVKQETTARAIELAPRARLDILAALATKGDKPASVLGDLILMIIGGMSFGSSLLMDSNRSVLARLLASPSSDNLERAALLIGGLKGRLSEEELAVVVDQTLDAIAAAGVDSSVEMRFLSVLSTVSEPDTKLQKSIARKLKRMVGKYPELARTLFMSGRRARKQRSLPARRR